MPPSIRSQALPKAKGSGWTGYSPQSLQFDLYNPQQLQALDQARNTALGMLGRPQFNTGTPLDVGQYKWDFAPIAQQARTQFAQQTLPSIAERFTGLGAQRSSAFGQQLGAAGSGLEEALASLGAQYGLQNRGQEADIALRSRGLESQIGLQNQQQLIQYILSLLGIGTQRTFENAYVPRQPGFFENAGTAVAGALPKAAAIYYGG